MESLGSTSPRAVNLLKRVQGDAKIVPDNVKLPTPPPAAVPPVVESKPAEVPVSEDYDLNPPQPEEKKENVPEVKKEVTAADFVPEDPTDEIDALFDPKDPVGANFKKLRTKLKSLNTDHKKNLEELSNLRKKVTDYESGIEVPEVTKAQISRIQELEVYEQLYNFKGSAVYQEKFAKPIQEDQEKLALIAKEHNVSTDVVNAAILADSTVKENQIISEHFKDDLTRLEVKSLIKSLKKTQDLALEAEKEPAKSLARMQQENDAILAEKRAKANEGIVYASKGAWTESLVELRKDPRFPEITFREGDTEHNEKFVKPILTKAAQEYGRIVRTLAQHGLTELPSDAAMALARMTQLAHQSAAIGYHRDQLAARVHELETLMRQKGMISRPGVNNTAGSNGVSVTPTTAVGPENAGRKVLSRVMGK